MKPSSSEKSIAPTPGAMNDEKMTGVFRLESASAQAGEPPQIQFAPPPSRKISTQILGLVAVLALGGGLLYAMRLVGIGPLKNFALAKAPDYDLSQVGVNKTSEHKRVLEELTANYTKAQVPLDKVQRNPFRLAEGMAKTESKPLPGEDPAKASEAAKVRTAEQRRQKIRQTLDSLVLNGVLGGSNPVARISGDAVRVGDTVAELFTVKAIHGRSVDLEVDGQTFSLDMHDDAKNATKKPAKK